MGEDIDSWPNEGGQYILFSQRPNNSASGKIKFVVVDVTTKKVIEQRSFTPGYVKWVTNASLEVLSMPGMAKKSEDISKYIQVIQLRTPD